jgi:hypothetical protein
MSPNCLEPSGQPAGRAFSTNDCGVWIVVSQIRHYPFVARLSREFGNRLRTDTDEGVEEESEVLNLGERTLGQLAVSGSSPGVPCVLGFLQVMLDPTGVTSGKMRGQRGTHQLSTDQGRAVLADCKAVIGDSACVAGVLVIYSLVASVESGLANQLSE